MRHHEETLWVSRNANNATSSIAFALLDGSDFLRRLVSDNNWRDESDSVNLYGLRKALGYQHWSGGEYRELRTVVGLLCCDVDLWGMSLEATEAAATAFLDIATQLQDAVDSTYEARRRFAEYSE